MVDIAWIVYQKNLNIVKYLQTKNITNRCWAIVAIITRCHNFWQQIVVVHAPYVPVYVDAVCGWVQHLLSIVHPADKQWNHQEQKKVIQTYLTSLMMNPERLTPFNFFSYLGSHAYLNLLERWQNWLRQTYWEKGMFIWSRIPAHLRIQAPFPITDRNYQFHATNDLQCLKWQVHPKIRIGNRQITKTHFCMQMFGLLKHVFNKRAFKAWNGKAVFVICRRIIAVLSPLQ